ncbi:hypothetical protein Tco_0804621 [Tanacetum coccineum]|uniref:Uncharacterized protein n=1 Tax=Tanacetum coccineum TaxID=301880 RepID=A0ABQ5A9D2_9ASTR
MQNQTSSALHNAIMEAGGKDRPPMLALGNYVQWKSIIKRYIDTKPNHELIYYCLAHPPYKFKWAERTIPVAECSLETTTEGYMENYKNVSEDIQNLLNAKAEVVHINLTVIDNDIYFIVDACPNAMEMRKAIERLKQVLTSITTRMAKQHHNKVNEIRAERLARTANPLALVAQQQPVYHPQPHRTHYTQNFSTRSQQAATRNRGKVIVNSPPPTYDQEPDMVTEDDVLSKEKEIDKLMALISLSFKKIYKPTNNSLKTSSNTSRANQNNTLRINKGTGYDNQRAVNVAEAKENVARECQKLKWAKDATYHKEKMLLCKQEEAGIQLSAGQVNWRDDTDYEPEDQELEAHYLYMAKIQEVTPDAADNSGPIFDAESLQKVQNDDANYNVFANDREHPEQPESVNDTYPDEQGDINITTNSVDMSTNGEEADQDDDDLARERDLLASLIEKLKCEINDSKNHNKLLESSNKTLVDKLKRVIPTTSVSRAQLKSKRLEDRVFHNNSQGKKQKVEDRHRIFKFSNNKTSVTMRNDSLNAKTSNVNFVLV